MEWLEQKELDILVAAGFAELDSTRTQRNKEQWAHEGGGTRNDYLLRPMYRWTDAGKIACRRYRFSTPMSWAQQMHEATARHCIHCGRDTAGRRVAAQYKTGSAEQRHRTVCVVCGAAGRTL